MKLFVFDIDGTLTDSVNHHQTSYLNAYAAFEIASLNTDWGTYAHHSDSWILGEVFRQAFDRDPTHDERERFVTALCGHFDGCVRTTPILEIPGSKEFLTQVMRSRDTGYAFATGSFRGPAIRKLEALGVRYPSELLVTASEHQTREDIVSAAIESARNYFGVDSFESITSFGDGYWDCATARKLGIEFVGIANGAKASILKNAGATVVHPDFSSVGFATVHL